MNEKKPSVYRRVVNHLNENKDIYVPVVILTISVVGLSVIGYKINKAAKAYETEALAELAKAPVGSRLLIDAETGDFVISSPVPSE